ncbi:MAG: hypothetical protein ACRDWD_07700 [Acidimicrobiia bacterium]
MAVTGGRIATVILAVALLAGACDDDGGSSDSATDDVTTDLDDGDLSTGGVPSGDGRQTACDLFTVGDAEDLLGGPVENEMDTDEARASTCAYVLDDDATVAIGVGIGTYADTDAAENAFLGARANAQFDMLDPQDVDGLGDEAYWVAETTNFTRVIESEELTLGELEVRDGTTLVTVYLTPPDQDTAEQAAGLVLS